MGRGTASTIFWHIQYLTGAVPLQRIYLSQALFELVLHEIKTPLNGVFINLNFDFMVVQKPNVNKQY